MKKKILIIENEILIASWLKMQLEDEGYEVYDPITYGEEALKFVKTAKPDITLMDIHLNGEIDGIETAKKLFEGNKTDIIFITGYQEDHVIERAKQVKHLAYLIKPIDVQEIINVIESSAH